MGQVEKAVLEGDVTELNRESQSEDKNARGQHSASSHGPGRSSKYPGISIHIHLNFKIKLEYLSIM